ncbi:MAG: dihydrofolate reductase [Peptococcaceae bacterium]|nr:dihydrofolate reductase [Peptococcaceae bacterium]
MYAIVSVDQNWGIGRAGNLLKRIPEDMAYFKAMTLGHIVVMGRETMESLPRQAPLRERVNLVLSRSLPKTVNAETMNGFHICPSLDEMFQELARHENTYGELKKFVIGGETVYRQLLPYCHTAYVTKFVQRYDKADRFFPNLDEDLAWHLSETGDSRCYEDLVFHWDVYRQQKPLDWRT